VVLLDLLDSLVGTQKSRPLSISVAVASLLAPGTLIIYLARPAFFWRHGLPTVAAISAIVSLPLLMISFGIFHGPLTAARRAEALVANGGVEPGPIEALTADDPIEWPCVLAGAWLTTWVLYVVAAVAYFKPIRIGLTLLLVAGILSFVWLVASVVTGVLLHPSSDDSADAT